MPYKLWQKCKSLCIGGPGDDNLYILKIEQTRTGVLTYVLGMCSYLVSDVFSRMFSILFDWSFFWFFYFVLFSSGTKGLDTLTFLETLKVRIFNYALQISDYNAHNLLLCRKYSLTMFFHHWFSIEAGNSDFYLCL